MPQVLCATKCHKLSLFIYFENFAFKFQIKTVDLIYIHERCMHIKFHNFSISFDTKLSSLKMNDSS